ncbi:phospholipid carrier-dependent glycosyltransferase [Nocardioides sp. zg-DK7169]|nr:phospholipid carrier-dependent glycosyltransferase [Nocardioides sp. zg-DK7169]
MSAPAGRPRAPVLFVPVTSTRPAPAAGPPRVPVEARPSARVRLRGRIGASDPLMGWVGPLGVALLALVLRLWHLGTPREFAFDETYYAKDAWSLLNNGYVRTYVDDADEKILDGTTTGLWTDDPSMIVHPDVGKWLIALGEWAFGMNPFGWRVSAAVAGALMVLVMCRLVRRMTGSTLLGCVAGLLLSLDGLHFVLSRLALLDIFLALFTLCGVACIVNDRDWSRARLAALVPDQVTSGWGPVRAMLWRPWLLAGGVAWGLAIGTKWTALYPLAAFGLLCWLWSAGARRALGVRRPVLRAALTDGLPAFGYLVVLAGVVYTATWTGWLVHADEYEEHLSSTQYTRYSHMEGDRAVSEGDATWPTAEEPDADGLGEVTQSLRSLWHYHRDVYTFHTHFLNDAEHTYASKPLGWLMLNRPVGVSADTGIEPGTRGCDAAPDSDCLRQVLLIGTPVIWWGGLLALLFSVLAWVGMRDWRFGVAVVGTASTWLPWMLYDDRPIFLFYAVMTLPFVVLALTLAMGRLIGPSRVPSARRTTGVIVSGAFVVLAVLNFAWFWPLFTNGLLTHGEWLARIWFERWI